MHEDIVLGVFKSLCLGIERGSFRTRTIGSRFGSFWRWLFPARASNPCFGSSCNSRRSRPRRDHRTQL